MLNVFVFHLQSPKNYYVYNDIFRYQDEELETDEQADENAGEICKLLHLLWFQIQNCLGLTDLIKFSTIYSSFQNSA